MTSTLSIHATLEHMERRRQEALLGGDIATLNEIMADDLVHVHATGAIENKAQFLASVRERYVFKSIDRGDLLIRSYGKSAVMTGPMHQKVSVVATGEDLDMRAFVTQVWVTTASTWQQVSFHSSMLR
ncbi:MAG: nuclear transport factor 2 family protein [Steroidobacteraceae bacterium]